MAKPQGEGKAPLIIALVFFVLTTLALGVLVYMGVDEKAQANGDKKKAVDDLTAQKKIATTAGEKVLLYRELLGVNSQEESSQLKSMSDKAAVQGEHKKIMQDIRDRLAGSPSVPSLIAEEGRNLPGSKFEPKVEDVFAWDWADNADYAGPPKRGLLAVVVGAYAKQLLASQKQVTAEKNATAAAEGYQKLIGEYTQAVQALRLAAGLFPMQVTEAQKAEKARVDEAIKAFDARTAEYAKDLREKDDIRNRMEVAGDQNKVTIAGLTARVTKADEAAALRDDPFAYEKHHGKITGRKDNIVYLDIGSSSKVRPGLTFTVQPSDTPERGIDTRKTERILPDGRREMSIRNKGTIEVIEVFGPTSSQARITSEPDSIRDGMMIGDTLYNAAWRKGAADHVALYGVFDIDADGTDDINLVVKDLGKMGIIVDAVYDLQKKKWEGKITNLTSFVIEGYYPSSFAADGLAGAKSAIEQNLRDAKRYAQEQGAKIVRARDFFPRIGYRIRLDITPDIINRAYNKYLSNAPVDGAPAEAPKN